MEWVKVVGLWMLRILCFWFFFIPSRLSIFSFFLCFFAMQLIIGDTPIYLFNRHIGGAGSLNYGLFWIGLGIPLLISFFSMFGDSTNETAKNVDSKLQQLINYRNGQILHKTPKEGYEIYKQTALLDVMSKSEDDEVLRKVKAGFNASQQNLSVTRLYEDFINKDEENGK